MSNPTTLYCKQMTITPAMALDWLENANVRNRPLSEDHVNKLARDMKNGKWKISHEGIAFDPHGILLDGQHRLWAIVESQVSIDMLVFFNVPQDSVMVINGGRVRTVVDVLKLANRDGQLTSHHTSTLRRMLGGGGKAPRLTPQETSDLLAEHREAVDFAVTHLSRCRAKGICNATTRAVIARAWYAADPEMLIHFCQLLTSGIISNIPAATVMVTLRQYLSTNSGDSDASHREKYSRVSRALVAFLRGEPLVKLVPTTKEYFPLPQQHQIRETA